MNQEPWRFATGGEGGPARTRTLLGRRLHEVQRGLGDRRVGKLRKCSLVHRMSIAAEALLSERERFVDEGHLAIAGRGR